MKTNRSVLLSPARAKQLAAAPNSYADYMKSIFSDQSQGRILDSNPEFGRRLVKPSIAPDDHETAPVNPWYDPTEIDEEQTFEQQAAPVAPRTQPAVSFTPRPIRHVPRLLISDFAVKPLFYMGVEFEGLICTEAYRSFKASMCDLAHDEDGNPIIQFGVDASVKNMPPGYQAVEIRTSVVRSRAGVRLFEEMLCFLYLASQTGDWLTNDTCGLHINISEQRVFDEGKQADYYCHVLAHFDEAAILATFGRDGNKYCLPFFKGAAQTYSDAKRLYANLKRRERAAADRGADKWHVNEGKYLAVSLRHSPTHESYDGQDEENQRIEFRCLGNTDYHLRFDELDEAVNHIISVIRLAYREVSK